MYIKKPKAVTMDNPIKANNIMESDTPIIYVSAYDRY